MNVETKFGTQQGQQDSWVGKGEVITDGQTAHTVKRGSRVGTDDVPAKTEGGDVESAVLGNLPWIRLSLQLGHPVTYAQATRDAAEKIETYDKLFNKKRSDDIETRRGTGTVTKSTEMLREKQRMASIGPELALVNQAQQDQADERPIHDQIGSYNKGKNLPKYKNGNYVSPWGNYITAGLGTAASLGQYINARNLKLNSPDIYAGNQYESLALNTLAGLRDNPYNQLRAMQDVEARNRYGVAQSGGLTGGLKYLAGVASGIGMQRNYADILNRSHAANNQYKAQWANAALSVGAQNAQRQQLANQYRDEAYARSHAARQQQMQMAIQNGLGQVQQLYANEFKRNQFNKMMELYWAEHNAKYPNVSRGGVNGPHTTSLGLPGVYTNPDSGQQWNFRSNVLPQLFQGLLDLDILRGLIGLR